MGIDMGVARGELELDFTNFQTACKTAVRELENVDRQGELLRSEFKELTSSSSSLADQLKGMEKSTKLWSNEIKIANDKAKIYSESIKGLNGYISECERKQKNLKSEIEKVQAQYDRSCEKAEKLAARVGKESEEYKKAVAQSEKYRAEQLNLESQYEELGIEIANCRNKTTEYQTALNNTQVQVQEMSEELYLMESSLNRVGTVMDTAGTKMKNFGDKLSDIGGKMSLYISTPVASLGVGAFKAAADFETAFTGVTKTVDGTASEILELRQGIIDMAKELPASTTEISAVAEAAGQLGIQVPNILGFTRTMIDLGNSTNLSAEEGATALARFANVTEMSQEDFDRLGSTIVDLGNKFATTEREIVEMGSRLVGAGHQVGMTEPEIMGFAAALSSVGIEAEAGGTAFSTLMSRMQLAVVEGGKSLDQFASVAGMSAAEFKNAFEQDAAGAIVSFIQGLSTCEDRGQSAIQVLTDMELSDVRLRDAILRTAGASDMFTSAVETGTAAWEENTALTEEANRFYDTTANKIKVAKNQITDAARVMGENMLPVVADLAEDLSDLTEKFADLPPETQKGIIKFGALVAAAGPVTKVTGTLASGIGSVTKGFGSMAKKLSEKRAFDVAKKSLSGVEAIAQELGTTTTETGNVFTGFKSIITKMSSPVGWAALGATALAGIGLGAWEAHKYFVDANLEDHFGDIKLSAEEVEDVAKRLTTTDWTVKLQTSIEETQKLEDYQQEIRSAVDEMNKLDWKVSVGLELTEEEKGAYKESIDEYVSNAQEYILQRQYVAHLNLSMVFGDDESGLGDKIIQASDQIYSESYATLLDLGEQMSEAINKGAEDNVFNAETIANIKKQMDDELQKLEDQRYEAQINYLGVSLTSNGLDKDSFNEVVTQAQEQINQQMEDIGNFETQVALEIQIQKDNGEFNDENGNLIWDEYQKALDQIKYQVANRKAEVIQPVFEMELSTIVGNYQEELDAIQPQLDSAFSEALAYSIERGAIAGTESGKIALSNSAASVVETLSQELAYSYEAASAGMSSTSKSAMKKLLKEMEPTTQQLEEQAQVFRDAGKQVPRSISEGLTDYYELQALMGDVDAVNYMLGQKLSTDPQFLNLLATSEDAGKNIDQSVAKGMMDNVSFLKDAATGTVYAVNAQTGQAIAEVTPEFVENMKQMGYAGITSADDLVSNSTLKPPGIDTPNWTAEAYGGLATMDTTVANNPLGAAGMEDPDWSSQAEAGQDSMQSYLDRHPLIAKIKAVWDEAVATVKGWFGIDVAEHANGGFTDHEQLSWLSEGNKPEVVIPLSADKRQRALSLYEQTGQELGIIPVEDPATLAMRRQIVRELGYTPPQIYDASALFRHTPEIDYNKLGKVIADELRKAPVQVDVPISVQEGGVYLDNELVGRQQAPVISRIQAKKF